jgi:ribonuclease BN (tRNA processing enzyme)
MSRRNIRRWLLAFSALAATPTATAAPVANDTSGTQILFLGTASGPPLRLQRSEPSTLLIVDGRKYLIDCGIGTARRLVEAGVDSSQIKTIFFTHLHADHDMGLADVMANDFFVRGPMGAAEPINIYGPPQTKELVDAAFQFISVGFRPFADSNLFDYPQVGSAFVSPFVAHEIGNAGLVFHDDEIRVSATENTHYANIPAGKRSRFKSYSYRIDTPHGSIVFTGDTGPSDAVARLSKGADVLVSEVTYRDPGQLDQLVARVAAASHSTAAKAKTFRDQFTAMHLDAEEVGDLASKAGVKSVILYHFVPKDKADEATFVAEVKRRFSGPVFASDDLSRYCLNAGVVAPCGSAPR